MCWVCKHNVIKNTLYNSCVKKISHAVNLNNINNFRICNEVLFKNTLASILANRELFDVAVLLTSPYLIVLLYCNMQPL